MAFFLPRRWKRQPTGPVDLNTASGLLHGVRGLWALHHGYNNSIRDLVSGKMATYSDASGNVLVRAHGKSGIGIRSVSTTVRTIDSNILGSKLGISGSSDRTIFGFAAMDAAAGSSALYTNGTPSTGNQDWTLRKNAAATAWRFNIFGVVALDFTYDAGGALADVIHTATQKGTATSVWINGRQRTSGTPTINTTDATFKILGSAVTNEPWQQAVYFVGVLNRAWNDAEKWEFYTNPWQVFAPERKRIYVDAPAVAGGFKPSFVRNNYVIGAGRVH